MCADETKDPRRRQAEAPVGWGPGTEAMKKAAGWGPEAVAMKKAAGWGRGADPELARAAASLGPGTEAMCPSSTCM